MKKILDIIGSIGFTVIFLGGIFFLFYKMFSSHKHKKHQVENIKYWDAGESPRNGQTKMIVNDSVFVIDVSVDSAYKDKSPDAPDNY
jgi:hypothetical protein